MKINSINQINKVRINSNLIIANSVKPQKQNINFSSSQQKEPVYYKIHSPYLNNLINAANKTQFKINASEFNIEKSTLKNNVELFVELSDGNNLNVVRLRTKPSEKMQQNIIAAEILDKMILNSSLDKNSQIDINNFSCYEDSSLYGIVSANDKELLEKLTQRIEQLFNPDLSLQNFEKAKSSLIERIKKYGYTPEEKAKNIVLGRAELKIEDIEKTTLDDVKKVYNQAVSNSQTKIVISASEKFYNDKKTDIINLLENKIPKMQRYTDMPLEVSRTLDKNYRFEDKTKDYPTVYKYFAKNNKNTLKDSIKFKILEDIIFGRTLLTSNDNKNRISCNIENDYVEFSIKSEDSSLNAAELERRADDFINSLLNNKITQKELEKAKSYVSGLLTSNLADSDFRNNIVDDYMSNVISVNEINNILNNITADEINKAAQEIFSGFSSTGILN